MKRDSVLASLEPRRSIRKKSNFKDFSSPVFDPVCQHGGRAVKQEGPLRTRQAAFGEAAKH